MNFNELFNIDYFHYFILFTTNRCNLHCEHCITMCHKPLDPASEHTILRSRYEISLREVEQYCETFKGIGNENYTRLTGGEVTTMEPSKFEEMIETLKSYNRKVSMITNGYGLLKISDSTLKKIDFYTMDNHGINHDQIVKSINHLNSLGKTKIKHLKNTVHYDCLEASKNPKNKGKKCMQPMATPMLYQGTVYPCCATPFAEILTKTNKITSHLRKAGWTLDNPKLAETMENWRTTLPQENRDICVNHCWRPHYKSGKPFTITLKRNDVISK